MRYRLIKPDWGKKIFANGKDNPKFVRDIPGPNTHEGEDFSESFLRKQNELGFNIYFFPNSTSTKLDHHSMNGKDVDTFDWAYVDMDLKDGKYPSKEAFLDRLEEFEVTPTYVLDSGNGIHAYWQITDMGGDAVVYMALQKALIREFQTDQSIWTPLQLMRAAGYLNTKQHDNLKLAQRLPAWEKNVKYTVDELTSALPELTEEDLADIELHYNKLNEIVTVDIQASYEEGLPKKFLKLLEKNDYVKKLFETPTDIKQDRSAADMALANFLIAKSDLDREETLQVLLNTQKALSRSGRARYDYASYTVEKACRDCTPGAAFSAEHIIANQDIEDERKLVKGPWFLDALHKKWCKGQLLGLIAGAGVGKTSLSLKIFKEFITNNPGSDDIFFFFSLEMSANEILDRWKVLVGEKPEYVQKLFVIGSNHFQDMADDDKGSMGPNLQTIYRIVRDTCNRTGKKPGVVCIDHLDALEGDIDLNIKPNFGAEKSKYLERKMNNGTAILSKDGLCQKLKTLAQMLETFLIIQSQTTKEKDGGGDVPIGKNAAFGTSKFEWYCDYVVGVWRPLARMMDKCREENLYVTAYQYAKVREQKPDKDDIQVLDPKLVKFDPATEDFYGMTDEDISKFHEILDAAIKLREVQDKNKMKKYSKAPIQKLREILASSKAKS